jgi:hypothetical protein
MAIIVVCYWERKKRLYATYSHFMHGKEEKVKEIEQRTPCKETTLLDRKSKGLSIYRNDQVLVAK